MRHTVGWRASRQQTNLISMIRPLVLLLIANVHSGTFDSEYRILLLMYLFRQSVVRVFDKT